MGAPDLDNPIAKTHPHLVDVLVHIEDAFNISHGSNKFVDCKCPTCGFTKRSSVGILCRKGFYCPVCSDGLSYPEKFMINLLTSQQIKFKYQLSKTDFSWCDIYRYDFYLTDYEYIIETHGSQHYTTHWGAQSPQETQERDRIKKELALANGISQDNYIIVDCSVSDVDWIKNSIAKTALKNIIRLEDVDWNEIDLKSHKSLVKQVCDFYEQNKPIDTKEIANHFHIHKSTVVRYLKIGFQCNFCSYDSKKALIQAGLKGNEITKKLQSHPVQVFKDGCLLAKYPSAREAWRRSKKDFGIQFTYASICDVCRGRYKSHYGYVFKYV